MELILQNVTKQYKEKKALADVSHVLTEGIYGLLGPNGAGKTTLLRMIAGIMNPSEGTIIIDGKNYQQQEIEVKKNLAYLSGNTKIYQSLSAYELLEMCCEFYNVEKSLVKKRILEISKTLEMDSFLYNRIENLSTGQTQRVNIARCLVHDPDYYILDESTSGLDIISSQIILDFIKKERDKGKCILYSTHYMEEAENICNRVIMVNHGKIIATGTPEEIRNQTKTTNLRDAFFALIGGNHHEE